ncbi:hypothetical protein NQZ68_022579 [Dissostichus eleginoides]|nr:hypothetical protein NQZ68_022579 [Dissostichus eleginoides]
MVRYGGTGRAPVAPRRAMNSGRNGDTDSQRHGCKEEKIAFGFALFISRGGENARTRFHFEAMLKLLHAVQPRKLRLSKRMDKFDTKANTWVQAQKKNNTSSHLRDQAALVGCNIWGLVLDECDEGQLFQIDVPDHHSTHFHYNQGGRRRVVKSDQISGTQSIHNKTAGHPQDQGREERQLNTKEGSHHNTTSPGQVVHA